MSVVPFGRKDAEKELDLVVAESCVSVVSQNASSLEEVKRGKALFESKVLNKYEWKQSSTFLVTQAHKIQQDVETLAKAKNWSPEFSNKVINLAKLSVKDEEMQIKFCTDSTSGIELAIIACCKGQNDDQYVKVLRIENVFNLAPNIEIKTLEDREPIHVTLKSGFSVFGIEVGHEHTKHVGDKIHQRIEKIVIPQKATAGEFESMHKYLVFRLCQIAAKRYLNSLDVDMATKNMLQWDGKWCIFSIELMPRSGDAFRLHRNLTHALVSDWMTELSRALFLGFA